MSAIITQMCNMGGLVEDADGQDGYEWVNVSSGTS